MDLLGEYGSECSDDKDEEDSKQDEGTTTGAVLNDTVINNNPASTASPPLIQIVPSKQTEKDTFVRSVPHIPGKWSGHVFAPLPSSLLWEDEEWRQAMEGSVVRFQRHLQHIGFLGTQLISHLDCSSSVHLTLSRHFALQLSSIDSFVERLQKRVSLLPATTLRVKLPPPPLEKVLVNDERTRSFWTWPMESNPTLLAIVEEINAVLKMYNQPPYYEPPLFHISLASVAGDIETYYDDDSATTSSTLRLAPPSTTTVPPSNNNVRFIPIKEIHCTFGTTKKFKIKLHS